jgi:cell fate (sporulation/competence/biofilm development) regulator YmcA (YheA/YmcA/DUF963 family)
MAEAPADGRGVVSERARELVEALRATPTIERFRAAQERFRADEELGRMQAELRESQERLQHAQSERRHDPQLFKRVRDLQEQLQQHPLVLEFVAARQEAQDLLRLANQEMTAILGLDVAANTPRTGCCS